MTWRMKLADWISGGELSFQTNGWKRSSALYRNMCDKLADLHELNGLNIQREARLKIAMRKISAMETPHANATVKRMAKAAREAAR